MFFKKRFLSINYVHNQFWNIQWFILKVLEWNLKRFFFDLFFVKILLKKYLNKYKYIYIYIYILHAETNWYSSEPEPRHEFPATKAKTKGKGKNAEDAEAALWERVPTLFVPPIIFYLNWHLWVQNTGGKICKGSVISKLNTEYLLSELKVEEQISFP